jgi:hypothetical protein
MGFDRLEDEDFWLLALASALNSSVVVILKSDDSFGFGFDFDFVDFWPFFVEFWRLFVEL